jgi:hypothetical protein
LGGLTGRGKPTTPEELVSRRLETLAAATANWSAPTVELRYGTDDKAAVHLDAKLFAARGYDAGKPADPAIRNVLIGLAALATEASGEGTDRVTYRRRV